MTRKYGGATSKLFFLSNQSTLSLRFLVTNISLLTTDSEKASAFNHYFSQQCVPLDPNQELPDFCYITNSKLPDFCIHERDVLNELQSLQSNKATGPDGLGNIILKHIANSIYPSLTKLFNCSLQMQKFPSLWILLM